MSRILIVCPYPAEHAPSERFRFGQYIGSLREVGHRVDVRPFWTEKFWKVIYLPGRYGLKFGATLSGLLSRFFLLFDLGKYDRILLHREATPIGPAWWEWAAVRLWGKALVYDFDDAVWLSNSSDSNAKWVAGLKNHRKTKNIVALADVVFAGNAYLAEYAGRFNPEVRTVPTTIDTDYHRPPPEGFSGANSASIGAPTIGWTGTHSTLKQLEALFDVLGGVHDRHGFRLLIIADTPPRNMPPFAEFRKWDRDNEIADLMDIDIGVMPLYDTAWEKGKCGFKALQYMALEIPSVVSAVGANTDIVRDGVDGFWAEAMPGGDLRQWSEKLELLLTDPALRADMGKAGRRRVLERYSVDAHKATYLEVLGEGSESR